MRSGWTFWIDRGGTFTDCIGRAPDGSIRAAKVLSSDRAPLVGIRQLLGIDAATPIPPCRVQMGTTLATNALLERKGRRHVLLITRGLGEVLEIGTQQRPDLFDLHLTKPSVLYDHVIEIGERIAADGAVLEPLDEPALCRQLDSLREQEYDSVAVVLLHGYRYPQHEQRIAVLARQAGFGQVSCSHEVSPEIGLTARGDTTTADAYLTPLLQAYLAELQRELPGSELWMMQSNGGLVTADRFRGHHAILSGPAAGVVASARLGEQLGISRVIGFDMGGTSTDVSRYAGAFERVYETVTAGVRIKAPMIGIHTVAAGGGSICRVVGGRLTVGPDSAGAQPGPLCYGHADATELTVTDINLYLGRLVTRNFPFPLHRDRVERKLADIQSACAANGHDLSPNDLARGFLEIVNLNMAQAIKQISVARGHDVRDYTLCCFGGAGGQHACAVAEQLGIRQIIIPPLAGLFSAYGIGQADTLWEGSAPADPSAPPGPAWDRLEQDGRRVVREQGVAEDRIRVHRKLDLRYAGTETALTIPPPVEGTYETAFEEEHRRLYGYCRPDRAIETVQVRVEVIGLAPSHRAEWPANQQGGGGADAAAPSQAEPGVVGRHQLSVDAVLPGPGLVLDDTGTTVVEPGWTARVDADRNLWLEPTTATTASTSREGTRQTGHGTEADPVGLEVFNNLFMSIAEQMGHTLQRTAVSTNIKERLDFSCAMFDDAGRLVANAPHIPVHLGAMGETVRAVRDAWQTEMRPGDVYVTNNPYRGGSHLPDITVVTPVYTGQTPTEPAFYVASRAHHADVGGLTPGSMPAVSTSLAEEGIVIDNVRLVRTGQFDETTFEALFTRSPYPARNLADNRADLQAQIAANQYGVRLIKELVAQHGHEVVRAYMGHVRVNAADHVRQALRRFAAGTYRFADAMDDGSAVAVAITLGDGSARIDFSGTAAAVTGNLNTPPAVVRSAVLYVLRCLVAERIPLNEGCLEPLEIIIPPASLLDPPPGHAVAGGNVETSQRIVDVLLGALGLAAASQGTMNNLTFGDGSFGYYETVAGGVGAIEGYPGASGVHTHMTNTRITDAEVLESRHPVRLTVFRLRHGSGGAGRWPGGDGVVRRFRFLRELEVTLLTSRRSTRPFGLAGGGAGVAGRNRRVHPDGRVTELPGSAAYRAGAGEELVIETPGGGGVG